jgi:hypothetical protein
MTGTFTTLQGLEVTDPKLYIHTATVNYHKKSAIIQFAFQIDDNEPFFIKEFPKSLELQNVEDIDYDTIHGLVEKAIESYLAQKA